ncbi:hypothetical protein Tco_0687112, partial [Tanacetum coccineum]
QSGLPVIIRSLLHFLYYRFQPRHEPVAPPSSDYIPGLEDPQTPLVPQDEDECEAMFIQPHDPDYMPEPIYPEYIPLEDDHLFPDPEEYEDDETEDGPVDYPMDGGDDRDDDDGNSSMDDVDDEDEDEEDEEEEEHPALADSAVVIPTVEPYSPPGGTEPVIPPPSTDISTTGARITVRLQASISLPPEAEVERLLAMPTPSPSPPILLSPPSVGERLARHPAKSTKTLRRGPVLGIWQELAELRCGMIQQDMQTEMAEASVDTYNRCLEMLALCEGSREQDSQDQMLSILQITDASGDGPDSQHLVIYVILSC